MNRIVRVGLIAITAGLALASSGRAQNLISGSGQIQAVEGKYLHVIAWHKYAPISTNGPGYSQIQIGFTRIEWDDKGKTTNIQGLEKTVDTSVYGTLKVLSDLQNPSLANGIVTIEVETLGKMPVEILFGNRAKDIEGIYPAPPAKKK